VGEVKEFIYIVMFMLFIHQPVWASICVTLKEKEKSRIWLSTSCIGLPRITTQSLFSDLERLYH
jgi:hypothetical protein